MATGLIEFELWNRGDWPNRDVVGESFRAEAIRSLFPRAISDKGTELSLRAHLMPEPTNPHDRNAVMVLVAGTHVGYLSRDDAPSYQPMLLALVQRGFAPVVKARIWGYEHDAWVGFDRRGREVTKREFSGSVRIALDDWYMCVPINEPSHHPHVMLPYGSALQVRKEENHQDVLRRYVSRNGQCWLYGTLEVITETSARSSKDLVEVRIDDQRVGDLTPAMSAEFIPIIKQLADHGRATGVRLIVKGNQVKAEVVLHAQKAHQLDAAWISEHLPAAGTVVGRPAAASSASALPSGSHPGGTPPRRHPPVPAKPTRISFVPPRGWPAPPPGWEPVAGWTPEPDWPVAPEGWVYWRLEP